MLDWLDIWLNLFYSVLINKLLIQRMSFKINQLLLLQILMILPYSVQSFQWLLLLKLFQTLNSPQFILLIHNVLVILDYFLLRTFTPLKSHPSRHRLHDIILSIRRPLILLCLSLYLIHSHRFLISLVQRFLIQKLSNSLVLLTSCKFFILVLKLLFGHFLLLSFQSVLISLDSVIFSQSLTELLLLGVVELSLLDHG